MKTSVNRILKIGLVLSVVFLIFLAVARSVLMVSPIVSPTMEPLLKRGDIVVATRLFNIHALRPGDLVVVLFPTAADGEYTVREIQRKPNTPPGQIYLGAADANDAYPPSCGFFPAQKIKAKVCWIVKG